MPNNSYSEALKEAATLADTSTVILDTLTVTHPDIDDIYMVNDRVELIASIAVGTVVTFEPVFFEFKLPSVTGNGVQDMSLVFNNVDQRIHDFIASVETSPTPVVVEHRIYISGQDETALTESEPPLQLSLSDIQIDVFHVRARASFINIVNTKFPLEYYDRTRFPNI